MKPGCDRSRCERRSNRAGDISTGGFTILELMVSMAILSFMMVIAWSTTSTTADAKVHIEAVAERHHELRLGMARMVRDFTHAYISQNEDMNRTDRRTMFIAKGASTVDDIRYSSLAHQTLWSDANESEQTLISYTTAPDRNDSSKTNLIRRESRRLTEEKWDSEPAELDVLLRDIKEVHFAYFDPKDKEWRDDWDSTKADGQRGRLPFRVRITVIIEAHNDGDEMKLVTQARIPLQEEFRFYAN